MALQICRLALDAMQLKWQFCKFKYFRVRMGTSLAAADLYVKMWARAGMM